MGLSVVEKRVDTVDDDEQEESARIAYARAVGARLRAMRKQMHLSLQAVEATSQQEFKASVLGAYERGERAISVPRLQRLAKLYDVPVDQLLPPDGDASTRWGPSGEGGARAAQCPSGPGGGSQQRQGDHRPDQVALGERSRARSAAAVPLDDPGPPSRFQRADDHHPGRGPAGDRLPVRRHPGCHGPASRRIGTAGCRLTWGGAEVGNRPSPGITE